MHNDDAAKSVSIALAKVLQKLAFNVPLAVQYAVQHLGLFWLQSRMRQHIDRVKLRLQHLSEIAKYRLSGDWMNTSPFTTPRC
eukprot:3000327-Amphidinium_carterae.2